MRVAEKWDGRMPNVGVVPGTWKERARRAEAEAAAARRPGGVDPAAVRRAPEGDHREHRLAAHRAAAPGQRGAPAARGAALGLVAQRPADVLARDDRRCRSRSRRDGAGARGARRARRRATRAAAAGPPPGGRRAGCAPARSTSTRRGAGRGWPPAAPAADCDPTARGSRPARRPTARRCPRRRRGRRRRARSPGAGRRGRSTKSSTAVSTPLRGPPSARRRPAVGQPAGAHAGLAGEQVAALDRRLAMLGGDQVGREVVVAAPVRPADVVEEQQRQRRALRALADDPQLLADREVVVVAVDDHRVGQRDRLAAPRGSSRAPARGRRALVEGARAPSAATGSMAHTRAPRRGRPVEQQPGQVARVGADLDDRLGLRGVQAGDQQLGVVEQRRAPVGWFVRVGVEVECEPAHEGAAVYRRLRVSITW